MLTTTTLPFCFLKSTNLISLCVLYVASLEPGLSQIHWPSSSREVKAKEELEELEPEVKHEDQSWCFKHSDAPPVVCFCLVSGI